MKLKDKTVILCGLHPKMQIANAKAAVIWKNHTEELVITAAVEPGHSDGSLHRLGRACDYRTRYFTNVVKVVVARELKDELGDEYDVAVESDHIHCEYDIDDPKKI